jgi:hypothetical protein
MEKIKVEIDIETAEQVFKTVLKSQYKDLSPNIGGCPMFAIDEKENQKQYRAFKRAFKLVAEYNGVKL